MLRQLSGSLRPGALLAAAPAPLTLSRGFNVLHHSGISCGWRAAVSNKSSSMNFSQGLFSPFYRQFSSNARKNQHHLDMKEKNRKVLIYVSCVIVGAIGVTYASVPLYKVFCQVTGFGGTTQRTSFEDAQKKFTPRDASRPIRVYFASNVSSQMPWSFKPQQNEIVVVPGETALAFYTAENPTDKAITGVATYNVYPSKAGLYFNKIQCFCFEEQRLRAKEEVDMPVFFFIDPEILDDPAMDNVNNITLSYTFFKTEDVDEDEVDIEQPQISNQNQSQSQNQ